jgi:hypothetical protein
MMERHREGVRRGLVINVIRDHHRDLNGKLAHPPPRQQVIETVTLLGDEQRETRPCVAEHELALHRETVGERREGWFYFVASETESVELELHPLEEHCGTAIGVLLGVHDVAAVAEHELSDGGHDAGTVGAGEQQYRRGHETGSVSRGPG